MDVEKAIHMRKAIRSFKDTPINKNTIKEIVQTAEKTPSWVNSQPWHVYVARGNTLTQMRKQHDMINNDPNLHTDSEIKYIPIRDWDQFTQDNMNKKNQENQDKFGDKAADRKSQLSDKLFNAPAVLYLTLPSDYTEWSLYDMGAFGQSIMLAAKSRGIDSIPAFEFVKYPKYIRNHIDISANEKIVVGIGLGYRTDNDVANELLSTRRNIDDVIDFFD